MEIDPEAATVATPQRYRHSHRPKQDTFFQQIREIMLWRGWRYIVTVVVMLVTVYLCFAFFTLSRIEQHQEQLDRLLGMVAAQFSTELGVNHYATLRDTTDALDDDLTLIRNITAPIRPFLCLHPQMGVRFAQLDAAAELTKGIWLTLEGVAPLVTQLRHSGFTTEQAGAVNDELPNAARIVDVLRLSQPTFNAARLHIQQARAAITSFALEYLPTELAADTLQLQRLITQAEAVLLLLNRAPDVLTRAFGLETAQTYLVLAANNDEIRPSGGYISVWGIARVQGGDIIDYEFYPSTIETPDPPPLVMGAALEIPDWWLTFLEPVYAAWDGSWEADFAETARMAAWYYDNGANPYTPVNGVISIDLDAVQYLLGALGGCELEARNVSVTEANFRSVVYETRAEGAETLEHKRFLGDLYSCMLARWSTSNAAAQTALLQAILRGLAERHLAFYFRDAATQQSVVELGWAGTQSAAGQDYLMLADANVAANKSSGAVQRSFAYDISLREDGTGAAQLSVYYVFPESSAVTDPAVRPEHYGDNLDYTTLWQVFTPPESRLTGEATELRGMVTVDNALFTRFTGLTTIPFGGINQIRLNYASTGLVERVGEYYRYRLLIEKQLGSRGDHYHVTITLPANYEVVSTVPVEGVVYELVQEMVEYDVIVQNHLGIEVVFRLHRD